MRSLTLTTLIWLSLILTPAQACQPVHFEPFYRAATYLPEAVIGQFSQTADGSYRFNVKTSVRGTIPPGQYRLMLEGPFGPGDTTGMPCPTWLDKPLTQLPEGADSNQRWVLLVRKATADSLQVSLDDDYAAHFLKNTLITRVTKQNGATVSTQAQHFFNWFKTKPATTNSSNTQTLATWQELAPKWQPVD